MLAFFPPALSFPQFLLPPPLSQFARTGQGLQCGLEPGKTVGRESAETSARSCSHTLSALGATLPCRGQVGSTSSPQWCVLGAQSRRGGSFLHRSGGEPPRAVLVPEPRWSLYLLRAEIWSEREFYLWDRMPAGEGVSPGILTGVAPT